MATYITNAISLNMLPADSAARALRCTPITPAEAASYLRRAYHAVSAVGHADMASLVRAVMAEHGVDVPPAARVSVVLGSGDDLIVAQYTGPRLPEGCTTLPEGRASHGGTWRRSVSASPPTYAPTDTPHQARRRSGGHFNAAEKQHEPEKSRRPYRALAQRAAASTVRLSQLGAGAARTASPR